MYIMIAASYSALLIKNILLPSSPLFDSDNPFVGVES